MLTGLQCAMEGAIVTESTGSDHWARRRCASYRKYSKPAKSALTPKPQIKLLGMD